MENNRLEPDQMSRPPLLKVVYDRRADESGQQGALSHCITDGPVVEGAA